jgi:hypothetical protein
MATINSAQTGNFTSGTTWVGGVVPTVGDVANVVSTHVVTIDSSITCDELTNANTAGYFDLVGGGTINANITGSATLVNNGVVRASMTTPAAINGNTGLTTSTSSHYQVVITGTGLLTINGNCTQVTSTSPTRSSIYSNTPSTKLTMVGNITGPVGTGSNSSAVYFTTAATSAEVSLTGNVTNSTSDDVSRSLDVRGASSVVTYSGTATSASSGNGAAGVYVAGANSVVTASGTFVTRAGTSNLVAGIQIAVSGASSSATLSGDFTIPSGSGSYSAYVSVADGTASITSSNILEGGSTLGSPLYVEASSGTITVTAPELRGGMGTGASEFSRAQGARINITAGGTATVNADCSGRRRSGLVLQGSPDALVTVNGDAEASGVGGVGINGSGIEVTGVRCILNGDAIAGPEASGVSAGNTEAVGSLILYGRETGHVSGHRGSAVARTIIGDPLVYEHDAIIFDGFTGTAINNGTLFTLVETDALDDLPESDVREGVDYAYSTRTGTLAVPLANQVASGIPVDNTVGTAALSLADVAAVHGAQIAAAVGS